MSTVLTSGQLECLINFYWNPDAVEVHSTRIVSELMAKNLLEVAEEEKIEISPRGKVHVEHLRSIKLPVMKWVIK